MVMAGASPSLGSTGIQRIVPPGVWRRGYPVAMVPSSSPLLGSRVRYRVTGLYFLLPCAHTQQLEGLWGRDRDLSFPPSLLPTPALLFLSFFGGGTESFDPFIYSCITKCPKRSDLKPVLFFNDVAG